MSITSEQPCFTLIKSPSDNEQTEADLKHDLENGNVKIKIAALKKTIFLILNGERMPSLLMTIIRFVLPQDNHELKRLLLLYWEIVPKTSGDGKLLHEMILVCDAYRKDLQHSNEFIRGSTLRFLCKLKESELLEPLMPAIRQCLEHRIAYVRRNAILAIFTIYKNFDFLIPDAPELVLEFLEKEQDMSCKRNAFMMLVHADQERALEYLSGCIDQVHNFGDILQLVIVELVYKVCYNNPTERSKFIRCIYNLLQSSSPSVRYEAAGTLVTLSSAPTAVRAAATCYIDLITKESDNNVKLIVLNRLVGLKDDPAHERVLQTLVMDVVRIIAASDLEVRKRTLDLVLDLVTSRNIEELVLVLKKEVSKTHNVESHEDTGKYRQLLVRTLHQCTVKFPDVAHQVIPVLVDFLGDSNVLAAADVLIFLREVISTHSSLKSLIVNVLLDVFRTITNVKIIRAALWVLGEFANSVEDIQLIMTQIRNSVGEIPIVADELRQAAGEAPTESLEPAATPVAKLVTADGTYATQSALTSRVAPSSSVARRPPLRGFLMDGDFFIGASLSTCLAKLATLYVELVPESPRKQNAFLAESMLLMTTILHLGKSGLPKKAISDDDYSHIAFCLRVLSERADADRGFQVICRQEYRNSLNSLLEALHKDTLDSNKTKDKSEVKDHADDLISFSQLLSKNDLSSAENQLEMSLLQALGTTQKKEPLSFSMTKLSKVTQLTGFSDPVYAEAYVHVNQYDILLDVLVVNQTPDTLQALTLELATLGDLKLVEKPSPMVLAPRDCANIKASVKVTSTENGIIFGNIVYDVSGAASDRNVVVLSDIHIDIMDYIVPACCTDAEFRQMWAEFEWENKISVTTSITDLHAYLEHIMASTNMRCLTPGKALSGDCGFMAANLYARSIFGEDALANVSVEQCGGRNSPVTGHVRIRAKSQGMALSLGDKINLSQKSGHQLRVTV